MNLQTVRIRQCKVVVNLNKSLADELNQPTSWPTAGSKKNPKNPIKPKTNKTPQNPEQNNLNNAKKNNNSLQFWKLSLAAMLQYTV